jgi:hypothetical protein
VCCRLHQRAIAPGQGLEPRSRRSERRILPIERTRIAVRRRTARGTRTLITAGLSRGPLPVGLERHANSPGGRGRTCTATPHQSASSPLGCPWRAADENRVAEVAAACAAAGFRPAGCALSGCGGSSPEPSHRPCCRATTRTRTPFSSLRRRCSTCRTPVARRTARTCSRRRNAALPLSYRPTTVDLPGLEPGTCRLPVEVTLFFASPYSCGRWGSNPRHPGGSRACSLYTTST